MLNLDTHILVFLLEDKLTAREQRLLLSDQWGISSIVIWELSKLAQLGRIGVGIDDPDFVLVFQKLIVWPIDRDVCRALGKLDFRSDPSDELIAATSIVHGAPLVTRDRKLLASRVTPIAP